MIVVRRNHDLGLTAARRLAESMARRLQREHGGTYSWAGNELVFKRTGASGKVAVAKDTFEISVELSFLLRPLRSRIEREIRDFCDEHLAASRPPASKSAPAAGEAKPSSRPPTAKRREV
jgi:putative polyhydroxyalkanoate system protein